MFFYLHKVLIKTHKLHSLSINPLPHHASDAQKLIILASSFLLPQIFIEYNRRKDIDQKRMNNSHIIV